MNRVAAALLSLEAIVIMLAIPVAVSVSDIDPVIAIPAGIGVGLACFVTAALVRRTRVAYVIGSVLQLIAVGIGFVVTVMFFLGGIFAVLWFLLLRIGPDVERATAAREQGLSE